MALNLTNFAYAAARDLGCIRAGQTLSADVLADIKFAANQMLDAWLIEELLIPSSPSSTFNLTAGTYIYTIGPNEVAPNFTAERPTQIEEANIILNTFSPVLRTPLDIITTREYADIPIQNLPNTLPTRLYYQADFNITTGSASIFLWGGPISAYQLELFTWDQSVLRSFADLTTTRIYPPAYQRLIQKCLAVEIAPLMSMYCKSARMEGVMAPSSTMLAMVTQQANNARLAVESYNASDDILTGDPAFCGGGNSRANWSYLTGTSSRNGR